MKTCTSCNQSKELTEFHLQKDGKFGRLPSCKMCRATKAKLNYQKNREYEIERSQNYYASNKKIVQIRHSKYERHRLETDINFKLAKNLRSRLSMAIRTAKTSSAVKDLGCSLTELRLYLEKQFQVGMTWENYGQWEIDHIKPLSKFDLSNVEEARAASHFSNLQPLWANQNKAKGAA